ncbi:conserved hypothetical protein [Candidatus Sulfopaludibacter sp. SbA3]|nr:conserved hypothetical protein [Candidatus Sulfopaludibacter sp. SbA3]
MALMLRAMLADRFKMALHRETKMSSAYALVVGKGGIKSKEVEDKGNRSTNSGRGRFSGKPASMDGLAEFLSSEMDRPVVDMTELKGAYDLTLRWTPEEVLQAKDGGKSEKETYPPLMMALQEQLGLKLEARKAPIEILVIDHIERVPTEN